MQITNNPTNLEIYYCEECQGIVASTDLNKVTDDDPSVCPFCSQDSLVKLPKEDYQENFNPDLFPTPQNIILEKFFQTADNTFELLNTFAQTDSMILLQEQFFNLSSFLNVHLLVNPEIELLLKIEIDEDNAIAIKSGGTDLIEAFLASN